VPEHDHRLPAGSAPRRARCCGWSTIACPEPLATIVPATPDDRTWVVDTGKPKPSARADSSPPPRFSAARAPGHRFRWVLPIFSPTVTTMRFPAHHRAKTQRDRHADLDPYWDELRRAVELLLEARDLRLVRGGQLAFPCPWPGRGSPPRRDTCRLRRFWTLSSGVLATEPYCSTESLICLVQDCERRIGPLRDRVGSERTPSPSGGGSPVMAYPAPWASTIFEAACAAETNAAA